MQFYRVDLFSKDPSNMFCLFSKPFMANLTDGIEQLKRLPGAHTKLRKKYKKKHLTN